MAVAQILGV